MTDNNKAMCVWVGRGGVITRTDSNKIKLICDYFHDDIQFKLMIALPFWGFACLSGPSFYIKMLPEYHRVQ